jgi:hypothetical protein
MTCVHCRMPLTTIHGSRTLGGSLRIDLVHSDTGRCLCDGGKGRAALKESNPVRETRNLVEVYSRRANALKHPVRRRMVDRP